MKRSKAALAPVIKKPSLPRALQVGDRFLWPETTSVATVERVSLAAAYIRIESAGNVKHVKLKSSLPERLAEDPEGKVEFYATERSSLLAISLHSVVTLLEATK